MNIPNLYRSNPGGAIALIVIIWRTMLDEQPAFIRNAARLDDDRVSFLLDGVTTSNLSLDGYAFLKRPRKGSPDGVKMFHTWLSHYGFNGGRAWDMSWVLMYTGTFSADEINQIRALAKILAVIEGLHRQIRWEFASQAGVL